MTGILTNVGVPTGSAKFHGRFLSPFLGSKGTGGTSCEGVQQLFTVWRVVSGRTGPKVVHRAAKWYQTTTETGSPFDGGRDFWGRLVGFGVVEASLWFGRCPWTTSAFTKRLVLFHPSKRHFVSQLHVCYCYIRHFSIQLKTEMRSFHVFVIHFHAPLSPTFF